MATRKRVVLSLVDKVKVIRLHKKGNSSRKLAAEFNVGKTQINIIAGKEKVIEEWDGGVNGRRKLVAVRNCTYTDLNAKVYEWCSTARAKNIPLTGRFLQKKAAMFAVEMGHKDSLPVTWLYRFQIRHSIKASVLSGELADVKEEVVQECARRLKDKCEGPLPVRSFVIKGDECKGGKLSKDRLTVLMCASATSEKLLPLVIGRSANPRCFKSCHMTSLHATYESNNKAWMTGELFAAWICRVDNRMRRQNRHILLFLNNCGTHPQMELKNVKVVLQDLEIATNGCWHHPEPEDGVPKEASVTHHLPDGRSEHGIRHCEERHRAGCYPVADIRLGQRQARNDQGFSEALLDAATTDDDEWDDADLLPLLPHGITFKDYVASDNKVAMQTTISEDWESELVASARAIKGGGGRDDAVSKCEEDEGEDSPVIPWATAWSHSTELLDYAVATNNPALIALLSQARELIQQDCHKATDSRRQTSMLLLFTNK
ncbi:Tigger transposable element-derived protein 6 [Lamellibrachia satsuma]|nr:Tigger transposable element-derived protein 6 [Lamellibrachia satsuma]